MCELYNLFSLKQLIEEPTRETLSSSTLIDHIATSSPSNIVESGVLQISMSDHFMVFCIRKSNSSLQKEHKMIKSRMMKNFNEQAFLGDVAAISWEQEIGNSDDVNVLANNWSNLFTRIIEKHAPIRQMRVSKKYCPWINEDLKKLMRSRDKLKKAANKTKSEILMNSYKHVRNQVNSLNVQFSNKIISQEGNMKETWRTLNQILNKRSKSTNIVCIKDQDKELGKKEIAESMNQFFCSVGKDLASEIDDAPNPLLSGDYTIHFQEKRFEFRAIQDQELRDAVGKLKNSKSFGNDNISSFFLKLALPFVAKSLLKIFNTSLETSKFPDTWKTARVAPIFKDGDKSIRSNYRPISVLPVVSRLFEKLVFNQLYKYLDSNRLLSNGQSGFRLLFSTLTCLLKTTDEWYDGFDNGYMIGSVFIDLRKAFDTVNHEILCQKLEHYGVCDRNLSWFQSYLSNRKQFCRVNGIDSETERIEIGVPQGSCLGPLLFLVYINDLPCAVKNSTTSMYADDTTLFFRSMNIEDLNEAINSDLRDLDSWLSGNKLSLNVAKTQGMLICTKNKQRSLECTNESLCLK